MRQENYDIVVIGSGIGGMCTAALLSQEGYKTLVVERLPQLGGRFSTIEYKGFKLPTGATVVEMDGVIEQIFREVGAEFESRLIPSAYCRIGGKDYELPKRGQLRTLISIASGNEKKSEKMMNAFRRGLAWQEPSGRISFHDWLLQYTQDEKILRIFWGLSTAMLGVDDHELPAGEFFRYLKAPRSPEGGIAPRGNLSLMESLAKVVRANYGQIWTRCPAKQILVTDGVARGVIIQNDKDEVEITAKVVISDAGPKVTIELAGSENFDKGYLKQLRETLQPVPVIFIQVASDRPLMEYPTLIMTQTRRVNLAVCLTLVCPELAPRGKHLLISYGTPKSVLPPYNFEKEIELNIQDLKDNFPEFNRCGEILMASCFYGDWPGFRTMPGCDLPQKTPIENLYNVGDGVKPSGWTGLPACAQSARIVVDDIKQRFKLRG